MDTAPQSTPVPAGTDVSRSASAQAGSAASITFPVHEVEPRRLEAEHFPLEKCFWFCLKSKDGYAPEILACSQTSVPLAIITLQNSLLAAVHIAFSEHLPLTLSPDMIWLAIVQGFGRHVGLHAEQLRERIMGAARKTTIEYVHPEDTLDNVCWPEVFAQYAGAVHHHAGPLADVLESDFSTTGPVEKAASQVALMGVFKPYIRYVMTCICGIPTITLEGTPADWRRLQGKLAHLRGYDADWWVDQLEPVAAHFVSAAEGTIDTGWWRQIYKLHSRYGAQDVEGWIGRLFPYVSDGEAALGYSRRNPIFEEGGVCNTEAVPPGLADAPVAVKTNAGALRLAFVAGFAGVEDHGERGVRPSIGWAVIRPHPMHAHTSRLLRLPGVQCLPPDTVLVESAENASQLGFFFLPVGLQEFYRETDGVCFGDQCEIYPLKVLLTKYAGVGTWRHLGRFADGSMILEDGIVVRVWRDRKGWRSRTVALSFMEFLQRLIQSGGADFSRRRNFVEHQFEHGWMTFEKFEPPATYDLDEGLRALGYTEKHGVSHRINRQRMGAFPRVLQDFYEKSVGIWNRDSIFEVFGAAEVKPAPGTHRRWLVIGFARNKDSYDEDQIWLDQVSNRGVVIVGRDKTCLRVAQTLGEFLLSLSKSPGKPFWWDADLTWLNGEQPLWPDEKIEFPAAE